MDNNITLVGNVTREPELRYTPAGAPTCTLGLAVNRVWTDKGTGDRKQDVSYFDVVCWRDLATNAAETITKGQRLIVTGRLEQRSWEDGEGNKRSKVEVLADDLGPSIRWATAEVTKNTKAQAPVKPNGEAPPAEAHEYNDEPF